MFTYQQIDTIADSYNPFLLLISIAIVAISFIRNHKHSAASQTTVLLLGFGIIYFIYWLDQQLKLWTSFGLDYSTHTATSLLMTTFIFYYLKRLRYLFLIMFIVYLLIMIYQKYHSIQDILTTCMIIFPISLLLVKTRPRIKL